MDDDGQKMLELEKLIIEMDQDKLDLMLTTLVSVVSSDKLLPG